MTARKHAPAQGGGEHDELSMAICAIRYCLGRQSYIVGEGVKWAREYGARSSWVRDVVIEDIERIIRLGGSLGMAMDRQEWLSVLVDLKEMRRLSATPKAARDAT